MRDKLRKSRAKVAHPRRRWTRWLTWLVLLLVLASWVPVLLLRWFEPPTSAFMLRHQWSGGVVDQQWRPLEAIAPQLALSVLASEDQRFPSHHGFDVDAITQAIEESENGGTLRGASTISQQVAKNLFLWPGRNLIRKGLEAWFTVLLEVTLPKRRILEIYLNVAELGEGVYGAQAAARRYFARDASQLTPRQSALLAARLPNPDGYSIDPPTPYMEERVSWILTQIEQLGGEAFLEELQ